MYFTGWRSGYKIYPGLVFFFSSFLWYGVTVLPIFLFVLGSLLETKLILCSKYIGFFVMLYFFWNPNGPFRTRVSSICPVAKGRKTDWMCCQCSEWVCNEHSNKTIQTTCDPTIARNNHRTEKLHAHCCSKLCFPVLRNFRHFI